MTTPHPAPEERHEAAQDLLALETSRKIEEALVRHYLGGTPQRQAAIQIIVTAAIREAEAAAEARGRAILADVEKALDEAWYSDQDRKREVACLVRAKRIAAALSASDTKSDGTAGKDADPQRNRLLGEDTPEKGAGVAPGPSDPIPSQPDEREAIKTALIAAGCDTGDGSYVHAAMDSVIAAILAMQAERRAQLEAHAAEQVRAERDEIRSRVYVFRDHSPEDDESWESWYYAAFDMLLDEINARESAALSARGQV